MNRINKLMALLSVLIPFSAWAHPGHGDHGDTGGFTITHYFTEPEHIIISWPIIILTIVLVVRYWRRSHRSGKNVSGNA